MIALPVLLAYLGVDTSASNYLNRLKNIRINNPRRHLDYIYLIADLNMRVVDQ